MTNTRLINILYAVLEANPTVPGYRNEEFRSGVHEVIAKLRAERFQDEIEIGTGRQ
jgi:hypothetical protein